MTTENDKDDAGMEKFGTDPELGKEKACEEAYEPKPATNTPLDKAPCNNCAHFSNISQTRGAFCPYVNKPSGRGIPIIGRLW